MSYYDINTLLSRLTGSGSTGETTETTSSQGSVSASKVKEAYYNTLEDELVELNETSETDYEELLSDSATIEEIQEAILAKQQEITDKQTETEKYIEECQNAINAIIENGTDVIPEEVQEKYEEELSRITSEIKSNTGTIQENYSVITESTITISESESEIAEKEAEIEEKEAEIKSLQNEDEPDEDKIASLRSEISALQGEVETLQSAISLAERNISTAEAANSSLEGENTELNESQSGLMTSLMEEYYETHTEEDRVYEDSELKSQIEDLEGNIQSATNNLTVNVLKLSSDIELLTQIMAIKASEAASAASSSGTSSASSATSSGTSYSGDLTENTTLAEAAEAMASSMGTTGWCLKGVNNTLEEVYGFRLSYNSAYQAIPELQSRSDFTEVTDQYPSASDLTNLPAGAIVVWENSSNHQHGHISIALGDGREASDHIQNQTTSYGTQYHVFIKTG